MPRRVLLLQQVFDDYSVHFWITSLFWCPHRSNRWPWTIVCGSRSSASPFLFYSLAYSSSPPSFYNDACMVLWMQQKNHHFRWRASYTQNPKTDRGPHMLCWWTTKEELHSPQEKVKRWFGWGRDLMLLESPLQRIHRSVRLEFNLLASCRTYKTSLICLARSVCCNSLFIIVIWPFRLQDS